ncbi:MAG: hypothetical protein LBU65_06300, partial [Planctomycetaceae bacterium]|nr:hypothetical protein [Planctomycetaceae bacterium]
MSRQFSFGTVFRMTEKPLLCSFFESFGADVNQVPWDKLKRNDVDVLLKLFDELPPDKRNQAEVVLRNVHALSCEQGVQALGEAADELHADESWADVYLSEKNLYTKAMSAWLSHREIFDHAVRFYEMDSLSWWRKRVDLPKIIPVFDETVKENLEDELEQFFRTKQGRGFVCTAEIFARSNGTYYFYAYPDDYVEDALVHNETGDLVPQAIRKTFELVFAYDSVEGTCGLAIKAVKTVKIALEKIFLRNLLNIQPPDTEKNPFDLSVLLAPDFVPATLPEDGIDVFLTEIKYSFEDDSSIEHSVKGSRSVLADTLVLIENLKRQDTRIAVKKARFRFVFHPATDKAKTMTFHITSTGSCDMKKQLPEHIAKAHFYLKQWRIENAIHRPAAAATDLNHV